MALTLGLAACGGDGGGGSDTAEADSASTEEFLQAVDAACTEHAIAVNEASDRFGVPQRFDEGADYEAGRAEASAEQAAAAAALEPPAVLAADYEAFVDNLTRYSEASAERADLAAAADKPGYEANAELLGSLGNEQIELARGLGLQACARELSPESDAALQEVATRVLTGADPERSCDEDLTADFLRTNLGRGRRCVAALEALQADGAGLDYLFSTGIDEVVASANVDLATSAGADTAYIVYDFIWDQQRGAWVMDSAFVPGGPAPDPDSEAVGSA